MTIAPTLQCPCMGRYLEPAFSYVAPPIGETRFDLGSQIYARDYDRCALCSHWFGRHQIDLSRLYAHDYVAATYGDSDGLRRRFEKIMALPPDRSDNAGRTDRVNEFARTHGLDLGAAPRLLDVGAGFGVFPAAAKHAGWRVTAIELDARMAAHIIDTVGVEAMTTNLFDLSLPDAEKFDAVTFNKVLEHIEDPIAVLAKSADFLNPAGFVYLEVPDVAAAAEGPEREEFFIEHHHIFSSESVALLARRAGFSTQSVERLREPSGKYTLFAFLRKK